MSEKNNTAEKALKKSTTDLVDINGKIDTARGEAAKDDSKKGDLKRLIAERTQIVKDLAKEESNSRAWLYHSTTRSNKWGIFGFGGKKRKNNKTAKRRR